MSFHKKAFTLVELSIVIGLIAFIAIIFSTFDFSASNTQQKRDRLSGKISDIIRSLRTISTTGRTFSGATSTCSDFALTINTGSISTQYIQLSDTGTTISICGNDLEHSIAYPIFGDKNYAIKYMTGADIR